MGLKIGSEEKGSGYTAERQSILSSICDALFCWTFFSVASPNHNMETYLIVKVCPLAQACPQLALIIQISTHPSPSTVARLPLLCTLCPTFRVSLTFLCLSSSQNPLCP